MTQEQVVYVIFLKLHSTFSLTTTGDRLASFCSGAAHLSDLHSDYFFFNYFSLFLHTSLFCSFTLAVVSEPRTLNEPS